MIIFTQWFPGYTKPARAGVYQQMHRGQLGYQKWDGTNWFTWYRIAEDAANSHCLVFQQHEKDPWRGLMHVANK